MNSRIFVAAALLAMTAAAASAQPVTLSLDEAVRRGLNAGEEIQLSASAVAEAEQQVVAARSAIFPQVDGTIGYNRTIRSPYNFELPDGANLPFGQSNTWIAQVVVNQTLYAAGKIGAGVEIAKQFAASAKAQSEEEKNTIALAITEAYYDAALAREMAAIAEDSGRLMDQQLAQVQLLKNAGNASELDLLRIRVERQNLQPEITAAQNARDVATLNLLRLINLPPDSDVVLEDVLDVSDFVTLDAETVPAIVEGATERRPAVEAAERIVNIREQVVKIERADSLPTVDATIVIGEQALPGSVFPGTDDFNSDWSAGIGVRIPLFDGGRRKAEVRIAQEQQRQAELQLAQLREGVTLEVEQQRRELERAAEQIGARNEAVRQAQHAYELTELSYKVGNASRLDLMDARAQLRQATGYRAISLHNYYIALARLSRAAGMPVKG